MRSIHLFLSSIALLPIVASSTNPPYVVTETKTKNGNTCTVKTSLNCVYKDENGIEQPCLSEQDKKPFLHVREDQCRVLDATVTMSFCNMNERADFSILPRLDKTKFIFNGTEFVVNELSSKISPGDCVTVVRNEKIDACDERSFPIAAMLQGTMPDANGDGFCYGFARRKNRVRHIPKPIQGESKIFADCETDNEETGHQCLSSVSISCSYVDNEDGLTKSCVSIDDDVPFHTVRADRCADNPLDATLTMTMCNKNQNGNIITPYQLPSKSTYYRFNAINFNEPDIYDDILQGDCKTMTRQVQIDTCRKKWPMSVQLNANMTKSVEGNSYCYCYLFRKSVINVFPAPPNPSPPTFDETRAPTAAPTPQFQALTGTPTKKASQFPTVDVTSMPSSSPVPLKPIIITEITDPAIIGGSSDDVPRFVEMYVPDVTIHGDTIKDNLKLVIFPGSSTEPDWSTAFDLKGKVVDFNGFVTLCNEAAGSTYIDACSYVVPNGSSSPVNVDGCYNIAIVEGDADEYTIVDMYGIPGRVCQDTISDFSDGRAVRLDNSTSPNVPWDQYNWEVIKDEDIDDIQEPGDSNPDITPCDPSDIIITEAAYPNGLPSSRYIELYLPQCAGQRIKPGVKLVRWPEGSGQPSINHVALQDVVVPKDGFIVICQSLAAETTFSDSDLCDVIGGNRTPLGTDAILVIDGPIVNNISGMNVIDTYGFPGASGTLPSDFSNGRAVRFRPTIPTNSGAVWESDQWIVYPSNDGKNVVGPKGMDPRVWVNPIIITEITDPDVIGVDPFNVPRFVEMYTPYDGMQMKPVNDDLKLVVFRGSSQEPDWSTAFDLKGKNVDSNGYITLCNTAGGQRYGNSCDYLAFSNTAVNIDGCYNVAIVQGDSERYSVVDMYGIIGSSCEGTITDFSDGRAVRLENTTYPESEWDQYNWEVIKGEDIDDIQEPGDSNPDIKPCDPNDIIITELSDPKSKGLSRYIELYLPQCAGQRIKPGVKLVRWPEGSDQPSINHVALQDVVVPEDGFVLVCRSVQALQTFDIDTCEIFAGDSTPSGKDAVAVVLGDNIQSIPSNDVIDSYGYPGSIGGVKPLPSDFSNGRAVRLKPIIPTNSGELWKPEQWIVYPGNNGKNPVGPEGMDPRVWINPVILTEITDPSTTSVSSSDVPRFVEMYFLDNYLRGTTVQDDLKLVVFPVAATEPDWSTAFDLKGKSIGTDGFITVCNRAGLLYYKQLCDFSSSSDSPNPADYDGCYNVAIIQGDETGYNIVDLYGVIGFNCVGSDSDFSDGRAVRLTNATYPESSWEKYHWRIIKGADPDMADPHQWVDDILPSFCNLIITELASPIDNDNARYIELYSDNCAGRTIGDDFKVIHYDGGDGKPEPMQIDLEGMVIGDDGFLVLCTTAEANVIYDGKCDVIVGKNTPADNDGDESVAIVLETPSGDLGIVDIYGRPDRDGTATDQDFTDGRAVRDTSATESSDEWNPDDWFIIPGGRDNNAESDDMDPREWENPSLQIFITELADPADTAAKRFIEIYTPNYPGKIIEDDLMLVRFEGDSAVPVDNYVCLKGMKFNSDGFMVFCRIDSGWPAEKCQHKLSMDSVANVQGTDDVAIVRGSCADSSNYESIIDIFGVPGVGVEGPYVEQVFTRGRAVRRKDVDEAPKGIFDADDWMILPGTNGNLVDSEGCDPSEWNDFIMPDPLPDPPSSPSKGKGGTKSPKSSSKGKGNTLSPKSSSKGKGSTLSPKSSSKGKGNTLSPKSPSKGTLSPKSPSKGKGNTLSPKSPSKGKGNTLSPKSPSKGKGNTLSPKSPSKGKDNTLSPKSPKDLDTNLILNPQTKTKTAAPKVSPGGKKIRNRKLEVHLNY